MMNDNEKKVILCQLESVVACINEVIALVEQDRYCCVDVITQLRTARSVLDHIDEMILYEQLHANRTLAVEGADPLEREQALSKISELFGVVGEPHR